MIQLHFHIEYYTHWGQQVYVCGSAPELGAMDESRAVMLKNSSEKDWNLSVEISTDAPLQYYYLLKEGDRVARREWGSSRQMAVENKKTYRIFDRWHDAPFHSYLYASVFTESILRHETNARSAKNEDVIVQIVCPFVAKNQRLVLCGEDKKLGNWDVSRSLPMDYIGNYTWQAMLKSDSLSFPSEYKPVIVDTQCNAVHWEDGANRRFEKPSKNEITVFASLPYRYANYRFRGSGVAIPVFSLRSEQSFGIGDFMDLKKMVDWASETGQQLIQVLPVNDTTSTFSWSDSYPYSAISSYALHPIFLSCADIPLKNSRLRNKYIKEAKTVNALPQLDYDKVLMLKFRYFRDLFAEIGAETLQSQDYQVFYQSNKHWLFPYACYCALRDVYKTASFDVWGSFAVYNQESLMAWLNSDDTAQREVSFYSFLQFLLHQQLSEVKEYAHSKGIALKGDIPIGINRNSVDAWTSPHLFNLDTQTGAPPDDFSIKGQNWGFPTYNWSAMEVDQFDWWKKRFGKMADYFDAYRIDHILGFFRIWEIPVDATEGLLGHFSPALPYYAEELYQAGIPFDEERMVEPFIHESFLYDFFGEYIEEAKREYLDVSGWQRFRLKSICDTQLKISKLFANASDAQSLQIRDGLLALCTEVLFVRDREDRHRFHPRITAQYTKSYQYLDESVKNAFNRLYDDFYYHKHNYYWRGEAMKKLPQLIDSTNMLVCGEDLGMIPDCVPSVMNELKILSLEIQRMPKHPQSTFSNMMNVPYLSVCTTSTHDMAPLRLWWEENPAVTQQYYNAQLHREGKAPSEASAEICETILRNHLACNAMWVVLPWQDWISMDESLRHPSPSEERINIPSNPNHYWRYRMHISLDDLMKKTDLNEKIKSLSQR